METVKASLNRRLNRRAWLRAAAGACAGVCLPPLRASEPRVSTPAYNTLTLEEELALGRKFARDYEKDMELIVHPLIGPYLDDLVRRLGRSSQRPDGNFRVQVVNSDAVNACALPGGFLYVQRGLLEYAEEENELAGAIAHEVGHVVARHTTNQLMLTLQARALYEKVKKNIFLDNSVISDVIESLGGPVVLLARLKYSRENESEADLLGFYEMLRAGWNPVGLSRFFERIQAREDSRSALDVILSDHPSSSGRVDAIRRELQTVQPAAPARMDTLEFLSMKKALKMMAPAPKQSRQE